MGTGKCHQWSLNTQTNYGANAIYVSIYLRKMVIVSEDLIVIGSWLQIVGTATKKAQLAIVSLVFIWTNVCFGNGWFKGSRDLRELALGEAQNQCDGLPWPSTWECCGHHSWVCGESSEYFGYCPLDHALPPVNHQHSIRHNQQPNILSINLR